MTYMTKSQLRQHILNAPQGTSPGGIVAALRKQGVVMEGDPMAQPTQGFFSGLKDRLQDPTQGGVTSGQSPSLSDVPEFGKAALPAAGSIVGGTVGGILGAPAGPVGIGAGIVGGAAAGRAIGQVGTEAIENLQGSNQTAGEEARAIAGATGRGALEGAFDVATLGTAKVAGKVLPKVAGALKEGAERGVQRILAPTTKADKKAAEKITKELINRPLSKTAAITRKGMLEKATTEASIAGEAIDQGPKLTGETNPLDIIKALDAKKKDFIVEGVVVDKEAVQSINEVQNLISEFGDSIPDESLRVVRRVLDKAVSGKNAFLLPAKDGSMIEMKKAASNSIRGILAEKYPDLAKLNKEYTFWKTLEDVLSNTAARRTGQSSGLVKNLATVGAAVTAGSPTAAATRALAIRPIIDFMDSPVWRLIDAKARIKLADILMLETPDVVQKTIEGIIRTLPRLVPQTTTQ